MRKLLTVAASAGALLLSTAAGPASAAPTARACEHEPHGTAVAHAIVPHSNHQAHASIPHHCD